MSEELVYSGLWGICSVRDAARQYEAWAELGRETLGRFKPYEQACRAICNQGRQQQPGGYL